MDQLIRNFEDVFALFVKDPRRRKYKNFPDLGALSMHAERCRMIDVMAQCNFVQLHGKCGRAVCRLT